MAIPDLYWTCIGLVLDLYWTFARQFPRLSTPFTDCQGLGCHYDP